jgi:mannose-6-phosphate isomerase-like protein (cupin superfamily)
MDLVSRSGLLLAAFVVLGSGGLAGQGTIIGADSIGSARAASAAANTVDRLISGVTVPNGRVAVAALRRVRAETNALIHSNVTELYYITQGSGTLVTGGTLSGAQPNDLTNLWAGPGLSGTHNAGEARRVGPGDVVVVPAGTAHRFSELDGVIEYLVFRFEPVN